MRFASKLTLAAAVLQVALTSGAHADDWRITRLSGQALVFYEGRWTPLELNDIVSDAAAIRTLADGSLRFERDHETIDVEPDTQIRILDRAGQRYTTVQQYFGTVGVEANRENVKHFAVKTPYLAAVVKGTIFAVKTADKVSAVAVTRGKVGVKGVGGLGHGDVAAGQTATVSTVGGFSMGHGGGTAGAAAGTASSTSAAVAAATAAVAATASTSTSAAAATATASATSSTSTSAASASTGGEASSGASSGATGHAGGGGQSAAAASGSGYGYGGGFGWGFGWGFGHHGGFGAPGRR